MAEAPGDVCPTKVTVGSVVMPLPNVSEAALRASVGTAGGVVFEHEAQVNNAGEGTRRVADFQMQDMAPSATGPPLTMPGSAEASKRRNWSRIARGGNRVGWGAAVQSGQQRGPAADRDALSGDIGVIGRTRPDAGAVQIGGWHRRAGLMRMLWPEPTKRLGPASIETGNIRPPAASSRSFSGPRWPRPRPPVRRACQDPGSCS